MVIRAAAVVAVLALGACAFETGPVVGDWRGIDETISPSYYAHVEVILDGPPGATTGTYHYVRLVQSDVSTPDQHFENWSDRWTSRPISVGGQTLTLIHLDNLLEAHLADFILTRDDLLVPIANPSRPDLSRDALTYALSPVPRGSFGYGRP